MKVVPKGISNALSHRDYSYYIMGQLAVVLGFWMQSATSAWLVYSLTGSSIFLGTITFAFLSPSLIFSPFAGIIADKFTKKYVIYTTQSMAFLSSLFMGISILSGNINVWFVVFNSFVMGSVMAIEGPTRNAFMIELVGKADLQNAIALNSSVFNLGRMLGPAIGGILITFIGAGWVYLLNAMAFLVLGYVLYKISVLGRPASTTGEAKSAHPLLDGFIFAYTEKGIRYTLMHLAICSLALTPVNLLLPLVVVEVLQGESVLFGILSASSGIGAFIAAISLASRTRSTGLLNWIFAGNILLLSGIFIFAISTNVLLTFIGLFAVGSGSVLQMATINTVLQTITPDKFRGRVMSLFSMMWMGVGVLGSFLGGFVSEYLGVKITLLICVGSILFSALVVFPRLTKNIKAKYTI